jgi:hypothetical protein
VKTTGDPLTVPEELMVTGVLPPVQFAPSPPLAAVVLCKEQVSVMLPT